MKTSPLTLFIDHRHGLQVVSSLLTCYLAFAWATPVALADSPSSSQLFTSDWRFTKGDPAGAEQVQFDDSQWQPVRLPHDWAIAGPFDPKQDGFAGKLPWKGVGWYRKTFSLDRSVNSRVYLDFDGVMTFPQVYINGHLAGTWDYGYTSFRVDATPFVNLQGENTVAVRVDTTKHGTRWYPGAGIYRKVTLELREAVHIAQWGVSVTTPEVDDQSAKIAVSVTVDNHLQEEADGEIHCTLLDPKQQVVSQLTQAGKYPAESSEHHQAVKINAPQRWDVDNPVRYTLITTLVRDGKVVDSVTTPFGIRTFEFTADDGFHLNGRRVQLHGVNLHHDQGPLGAAFYVRAMQRQLEIMQDMGVNALRTSHNAPAPEVLELCDRMGILVWDECFDKWNATSDRVDGKPSHEEHGRRHYRSLVLRDRNHPSVIAWSIGNEIPDDREGVSADRVKMMGDLVRQFDPTRPVVIGTCFPKHVDKQIYNSLDAVGWNYLRRYANHREQNPHQPIIYSESASALSTRGFYELPLPKEKTEYSKKLQVNSYDMNAAAWSDIPDREFDLMKRDTFVAGEFVWTGFDYIGEPTPFSKEACVSYFGIVDLCGIPKDRFWLYRSYWNPEATTVHILPHWNWPERVGEPVPVFVYTNGDSAELFLNGKSLGKRTKGKQQDTAAAGESEYYASTYNYRLRWNEVPYELGTLKAVAYREGKEIGTAEMKTAGEPASLRLTPDRTELAASGDDLAYLLVEAVDAEGVPCPLAENLVQFEVTGPAEVAGVGNGNPLSIEPFQASFRKLFYGKAMLILRTQPGKPGPIAVRATSEGLEPAEASLIKG